MNNTNKPNPQKFFLELISMLQYPDGELLDIARNGDGTYFINGIIKPLMYEGLCRDRVNSESPGGYKGGDWGGILQIARKYAAIAEKSTGKSISIKDLLGPKLETGMESMIEHQPIASTRLTLGDAGRIPVFGGISSGNGKRATVQQKNFFGDERAETFAEAYKLYPNPKIAWALVHLNWKPPRNYPYTIKQLKKHAATLPENWRARGRLLPGLGISLNRSGQGENERCLITVYGNVYGGHGHDSSMGLFLDAFRNRLITQWGYPPNWDNWFRCWVTQNTGRHYPLVSDRRYNGVKMEGFNELNLDSGPLHISDSVGELVRDNPSGNPRYTVLPDGCQRRINILVDASEEDFYVLDFYRMFGGTEHWRSMQTLDGQTVSENLVLVRQGKGTLAGENVSYNDKKWWNRFGKYGSMMLRPLTLLDNVESASAPASPWSVTWKINRSEGLCLRMTGLVSGNAEIHLADGRDPQQSSDVVRRFVMTHHKSPDGKPFYSQTLNILEAFRGKPVVTKAQSLPVTGTDERALSPVGCMIKLENRTDYFILSADNSRKSMKLPNGKTLELTGRIGYLALDQSGNVKDMQLIAGTVLEYGGRRLVLRTGSYSGTITGTDYAKWTFDVVPASSHPEELIGRHIYIRRGSGKIGMEIRDARNIGGATRIKVNCDPLLFIGTSRKFSDNFLQYRAKINHGQSWTNDVASLSSRPTYSKATIIGKSGTRYSVESIGNGGIRLFPDRAYRSDAATLKRDFPVGCDLRVYDYGIGNTIEVPLSAGLQKRK